jgi:hypothetical protein
MDFHWSIVSVQRPHQSSFTSSALDKSFPVGCMHRLVSRHISTGFILSSIQSRIFSKLVDTSEAQPVEYVPNSPQTCQRQSKMTSIILGEQKTQHEELIKIIFRLIITHDSFILDAGKSEKYM